MAEKEYIEREAAEGLLSQPITMSMCLTREECLAKRRKRDIDVALLRSIPAADVLSRDEAIKMGAELFRYGMRLRGFSPGCQPMNGLIGREDDPTGRYWDILVYDHRLSKGEELFYELDFIGE